MMKCSNSATMLSIVAFIFLVITSCDNFVSATVIPEIRNGNNDNRNNTSGVEAEAVTPEENRVDITYDEKLFKEIDHDILQVIGDPSMLSLSCHSSRNNEMSVEWKYHGIEEGKVDFVTDENFVHFNLSAGPSVLRIECLLSGNKNVSNNTLVYTGDDIPPFLFNHGQTVRAEVLNETTARFPCLLNYPLEGLDKDIQLYKDGEMVENKDNCLSYTAELGYFLNLTVLENPIGSYECKVMNSTEDDVVFIELDKSSFIRVEYKGFLRNFFGGAPQYHRFECKLPKTTFQDKFEWYYLWANGSYAAIDVGPKEEMIRSTLDKLHFSQTVKIRFPSADVTHIVCAGMGLESSNSYNNSIAVEVKEAYKPNILHDKSDEPIIYKKGRNLTCATTADPVNWTWLKNGEPVKDFKHNISYSYNLSPVRTSTLSLLPNADEYKTNYTCVVHNFLGKANFSFQVQLKAAEEKSFGWLIITIVVVLAVIVLAVGLLFAFCDVKVQVTPRKFKDELIKRFRQGSQYDEMAPYASVSYDDTHEIPKGSLIIERELKGGNFGKVHFGKLIDKNTNSSTPVAIKTMKDDLKASEKDLELEFCNFLNEIKIMQYLGHHKNVVSYIGAVTSDIEMYSAYLVVEYCSQGDLATYLRSLMRNGGSFHDDIQNLHRNLHSGMNNKRGPALKTSHLMKWGEDIAAGMEYISSKNLVHMDLAARNILLAYQGINSEEYANPDPGRLFAKISDFGLSRNLDKTEKEYYQIVFDSPENNRPRELPLRWLSPEALESLRFTTQSDVWAMAITFWEMFTFGEVPYNELPNNGDMRKTLISHLRSGYQLKQPDYAPIEMWEIMKLCWSERTNERPSFRNVKEMLHAINENLVNQQQKVETNQNQSNYSFTPYTTIGFVENPGYNAMGDDDEDDEQSDNSENSEDDDDGDRNQKEIDRC